VAAVGGHDRLETTTAQPARMRAIVQDRYGGLEVLELKDIDRPVPMDDQVLVRSIGADHVIDYTREDVTDGTRHWDLIVDTAGHRSLSRLRRALTPGERWSSSAAKGEDGGWAASTATCGRWRCHGS
jgi:NADPH:quinone reductase-like Zn-dependent oxidoreductase